MEEGKLYCPACGKEIRMVPDFEPEIEENIQGAMQGVIEEIAPSAGKENGDRGRRKRKTARANPHLAGALASGLLIVIVLLWFLFSSRSQDVSYQLERAKEYAGRENYAEAVSYALKAVDLEQTNLEARNLLGEYYMKNQDFANAKTTFLDCIQMDAENEQAYENLIAIYEAENDYEAINSLIRTSASQDIVNTFIKYIANPPQFSHEQGTYEEIIPIKLTANAAGDIFYTMDGSQPGKQSEVYKGPIFLESGIYTIKTVFINAYGIQSEVATNTYQIHLDMPHEPEISPAGGVYTKPRMITVQVPDGETVYYTTDGSEPAKDSLKYTGAMALPMGRSTYKFISYSKDGASSQVITCQYEFNFESIIGVQDAVNLLVMGLKERGVLLEHDGTVPGKNGRNIYISSTAISINENDYYLVVEYYEDLTGTNTKTGNMYCVDANTGQLFRADVGADGHYSVVSF